MNFFQKAKKVGQSLNEALMSKLSIESENRGKINFSLF